MRLTHFNFSTVATCLVGYLSLLYGCAENTAPSPEEQLRDQLFTQLYETDELVYLPYEIVSDEVVTQGISRETLSEGSPLLVPGAIVVVLSGEEAGYYTSRGVSDASNTIKFDRAHMSHVIMSGRVGTNQQSEMQTQSQALSPERGLAKWLLEDHFDKNQLADQKIGATPIKVTSLDGGFRTEAPKGHAEITFQPSLLQTINTNDGQVSCLEAMIDRLTLLGSPTCRMQYNATNSGPLPSSEASTCIVPPDLNPASLGTFIIPPGKHSILPPHQLYQASRQCHSMLEDAMLEIDGGALEAELSTEIFIGPSATLNFDGITVIEKKVPVLLTAVPPVFVIVDMKLELFGSELALDAGGTISFDGDVSIQAPSYKLEYIDSQPCVIGKSCTLPYKWRQTHTPLHIDSGGWSPTITPTMKGTLKLKPISISVGAYLEGLVGGVVDVGPSAQMKAEHNTCSPAFKASTISVGFEARIARLENDGNKLPRIGYMPFTDHFTLVEKCWENDCDFRCLNNETEPVPEFYTSAEPFTFDLYFDADSQQDLDLSLELPNGDEVSYRNTAAGGWQRDSTYSVNGHERLLHEGWQGRPSVGNYTLRIHNPSDKSSTYVLREQRDGITRTHEAKSIQAGQTDSLSFSVTRHVNSITGIRVQKPTAHATYLNLDDVSPFLHQLDDLPHTIGFAACSSASAAMFIGSVRGIDGIDSLSTMAKSIFDDTANTSEGLESRTLLIDEMREYGFEMVFDASSQDALWRKIRRQLELGFPVIIGTRSDKITSKGHYALIVGISEPTYEGRALYLYDPMGRHKGTIDSWDTDHHTLSIVPFFDWTAERSDGVFLVKEFDYIQTRLIHPDSSGSGSGGGGGKSW